MEKLKILLFLLLSGLVGSSCQKEDIDMDLRENAWKVEKIRKSGQFTFTGTDSNYILQFVSDETYNLRLDVNTCFGSYDIPEIGRVEILAMACTKICCDSEFAEDLSLLLPKMTGYYARGDELHLEGEGKIVLLRL
ncbi:MAG: META domain-containing protein [Bacteroidales bacterium]|nr:META domain-containing protein [Bacteroidales bacterium]